MTNNSIDQILVGFGWLILLLKAIENEYEAFVVD